jgi:hypothetical protein
LLIIFSSDFEERMGSGQERMRSRWEIRSRVLILRSGWGADEEQTGADEEQMRSGQERMRSGWEIRAWVLILEERMRSGWGADIRSFLIRQERTVVWGILPGLDY